jgi:hypothetical protein
MENRTREDSSGIGPMRLADAQTGRPYSNHFPVRMNLLFRSDEFIIPFG